MNDLSMRPGLEGQTMSSREIADLCDKRHDNVMRDIRDMLIQLHGEGGLLKFEGSYTNAQNKQQLCFNLPKRETLILVSGYKLEIRARIIDRWQQLEEQARQPVDPMIALNDPATMRGLLLSYSEKVMVLEAVKAELTPKAEALDRIATADGSFNITEAAKALQMRPKNLFVWLQAHRWIYRRAGGSGWLGYQDKVQAGYLEHKIGTLLLADGTEKVTEQVRVTAKGMTRLATEVEGACYSP